MMRDDFTNVTKADFDKLVDAFGFEHPMVTLVWNRMEESSQTEFEHIYAAWARGEYSEDKTINHDRNVDSIVTTYDRFKKAICYLASSGYSDAQVRSIVTDIYDEAQFCYLTEILRETQAIYDERRRHIEEITRG